MGKHLKHKKQRLTHWQVMIFQISETSSFIRRLVFPHTRGFSQPLRFHINQFESVFNLRVIYVILIDNPEHCDKSQ